jgi:transposase
MFSGCRSWRRSPRGSLPPAQREQALARWRVLRVHLENGCPLVRVAAAHDVPERTLRRWLAAYRAGGLAALARRPRSDRGRRRMPPELQLLIEGLALRRPPPTVATVHRQAAEVAREQGWPAPGYAAVYDVVRSIDPAMATLAHEGAKRYREVFDLVRRREAARPNEIWQAHQGRYAEGLGARMPAKARVPGLPSSANRIGPESPVAKSTVSGRLPPRRLSCPPGASSAGTRPRQPVPYPADWLRRRRPPARASPGQLPAVPGPAPPGRVELGALGAAAQLAARLLALPGRIGAQLLEFGGVSLGHLGQAAGGVVESGEELVSLPSRACR